MGDVAIIWKSMGGDVSLNGHDLETEDGLSTAVIISLFTDRRAADDDPLPAGAPDLRGWWGDAFPDIDGDRIGSRLWLLSREKQTRQVINRAREYVLEALQWLLDDGVAASVVVDAFVVRMGVLGLSVSIDRPGGDRVNYKFEYLWETHLNAF